MWQTTAMLAALLLVAQAEQGDSDLAADVKRYVRELDADERETRDAAEKKLMALGPAALRHLPPITNRTGAEVKERLGRVRKAFELAAAQSTSKPSLVSLQGKSKLAQTLQALEKQSGNRIVGFEDREATIDLELDQVPYWSALDQVLDKAGLTINAYGGEPQALTVEARPDENAPRFGKAVYAGVFRFEAVRLEAVRDFRYPATSGLKLGLEISWEPRVNLIAVEQPIDQFQIRDDRGEILPVDEEQSLSGDIEADISSVELTIPLKLPDRKTVRLDSVKGRMTALIPGRVETFQFSKLENAVDVVQKRAGVAVTLEQVRRNVDVYEVRIRVRFDDAGKALESHRSWVYNNVAHMLDPDGQKVENAGYQTTHQSQDEVGIAYLFDLEKGPKGYTFVYETPASILQVPVEYELKNLELP